TDSQHLRLLACLEAECIVFAMEGLLLTHDLRSTEESGVQCLIASVAGLNRREKEGKLPLIFSVFPKFQDSDKRDRVEGKKLQTIASLSATLDWLWHHSYKIELKGESIRNKK